MPSDLSCQTGREYEAGEVTFGGLLFALADPLRLLSQVTIPPRWVVDIGPVSLL